MKSMVVIFSLIFLFVSHNVYTYIICNYFKNPIIKIISYLLLLILGQSFLLLFVKNELNRIFIHIIYFIIFIFVFLFFVFLCIKILSFFKLPIDFFSLSKIMVFCGILLFVYGFINRYIIRTTNYKIINNNNINLKIGFITDVHIGSIGTSSLFLNKMVEKINNEKFDLVIFGGDIIETNISKIEKNGYNKILQKIQAKHGVYGVLGNHEYYISKPILMSNFLQDKCKINILEDEILKINNLVVVGRTDSASHYFGKNRKSIDEIIKNNKIDQQNNFMLVVDHNPKNFKESVKNNIELQLSGHTHNGQFFPFNFIIKLFYEKPYGLLKKQNSKLITSSGLGTWGPPVKIGSKPEIVIIKLISK